MGTNQKKITRHSLQKDPHKCKSRIIMHIQIRQHITALIQDYIWEDPGSVTINHHQRGVDGPQ